MDLLVEIERFKEPEASNSLNLCLPCQPQRAVMKHMNEIKTAQHLDSRCVLLSAPLVLKVCFAFGPFGARGVFCVQPFWC